MTLSTWLSTSRVRHYPLTPAQQPQPLALDAALNEHMSFQVVMRLEDEPAQRIAIQVAAPRGWLVRVRRVGYVPMLHHNTPVLKDTLDIDGLGFVPGYVPDPLYDEDSLLLPDGETHAFWVSLIPGPEARWGDHVVSIMLSPDRGKPIIHNVRVRLYDVTLKPRQGFHITHWFYIDALLDWYKTDHFDERFWTILGRYMRDVAEHGQDILYVPVFTPPLDGVKRPSQLLRVERVAPHTYRFDWRDVKRYIDLARASGITHFEWTHFFVQWGAKYAIRIYEGQGQDERLLWDPATEATSDTYRLFLAQYLPELRRFLEQEGIVDCSFFHVSDEPHGEEHLAQYRKCRALLAELAPWMKVMDALTEIEFGRQKLTDMPIPSIRTALDFVREGIPCWCYYCCGPRDTYLNRLMDTPLSKIAMHGFLFYRWPTGGFLHWGYNYWYRSQTRTLIDPYTVQDGLRWEQGWAYGDTFEVYPGPEGPIDSLRWEVFGESLQDYALLQTVGISRDDPLLASLLSFADFPKADAWRLHTRRELLARYRH